MKKIISIVFCLSFFLFSFYYTNKISLLIIYKSALMNEIISFKKNTEEEPINAIINGEYIMPGLNGLKVDELKSYNNMKKSNQFIKNSVVYFQKKPNLSLEDHLNLIINGGNPLKNGVAIITDDKNLIEYSLNNDIPIYDISNTTICVGNYENCANKYKVKESYVIDNVSFLNKNIISGDIIKINSLSLENYLYLIKKLEYNNYEIMPLEKLISENR